MRLKASALDRGKRLDHFLHDHAPQYSRSRIQDWIRAGGVTVDGAAVKPSYLLRGAEEIELPAPAPPLRATPEAIPLTILYEDASAVVIDKPSGMAVHAGAGLHHGTAVNALLHRFGNLSGVGGELRPGIVHRLDRFTSGALVVAKSDQAHLDLAEQFASRKVEKIYLALVEGRMEGSGRIEKPISRDPKNRARMTARLRTGRASLTDWKALRHSKAQGPPDAAPKNGGTHSPSRDSAARSCAYSSKGFTLLRIRLGTGRTHQIRAHMAALGHPVAGDVLYGAAKSSWNRYFLHAQRLGFRSPATGESVVVESPLPAELEQWLAALPLE